MAPNRPQKPNAPATPALQRKCRCESCLLQAKEGVMFTVPDYQDHVRNTTRQGAMKRMMHRSREKEASPSWSETAELPLPSRGTSSSSSSPSIQQDSRSPSPSDGDLTESLRQIQSQLNPPAVVVAGRAIHFLQPPSLGTYIRTSQLSDPEVDDLCRLDSSVNSNSPIIGYTQLLARYKTHAEDCLDRHRPPRRDVNQTISAEASLLSRLVSRYEDELRSLLLSEWRRQRALLDKAYYYDSSRYHILAFLSLPLVILGIYLTVCALHFLSDVSLSDSSFILGSAQDLVSIIASTSTSVDAPSLAKGMFTDMRTVIKLMALRPDTTTYMVCPRCRILRKLDEGASTDDQEARKGGNGDKDGKKGHTSLPERCENRVWGTVCGARLTKNGPQRKDGARGSVPISRFHYNSIKSYLARIHSSRKTEQHLHGDPRKHSGKTVEMTDVWDSPSLSDLKGPDEKPFLSFPSGTDEGRLVFSMNMDGFNPGGNREAGKKVTVGAIYMICMNLPPPLRYKMENVYLAGIIPGPNAPSDHEINYFLEPLVDDLMGLWQDGVYLSQTSMKPKGHLVRCAVGPLVCDLPASRQMSGFAHYRSRNFCSECTQTLDNINDINSEFWIRRTATEHRAAANLWKNAKSQAERERFMAKHGVRWSELLRLPYWDPTKYTVIDSMHALYLRLFQHHCRSIWGMDVNFEDGDGVTYDARSNPPTEVEMEHATNILRHGTMEALADIRIDVLRQVTREVSTLPFRRKKAVLLEQLRQYRIRQGWFTEMGEYTVDLAAPPNDQLQPEPPEFNSSVLPTRAAVERYYATANKTRIDKKTDKPELLLLFRLKVLPKLTMTEADVKKLTVKALKNFIHAQRHEDGLANVNGTLLGRKAEKTRVLGKERLREIRKDMRSLLQPTWVSRAPAHPGEKKWGKFTADQWKTFCLQNLPITLIRLWGHKPQDSNERRWLSNFMHLVSAVKLASLHTIDEEKIKEYEHHMRTYLATLLELFPGTSITPYQHLALHFGDHLRRFGPVHSWRCFPFERFNYILQNFSTNEKFGELERTMLEKFCCSQIIRSLYDPSALPEALHGLIGRFRKNFSSDTRGTRLSDIFSEEEHFGVLETAKCWTTDDLHRLSLEDHQLLKIWFTQHLQGERCPRNVALRKEIYYFGQRFTSQNVNSSDSQVAFRTTDGGQWKAGSVVKIFSQVEIGGPTLRTWAIVQPYADLSPLDEVHDHYREWEVAGGRLYRNEWASQAIAVDVKDIACHIATTVLEVEGIEYPVRLALPLNK